MSAKTSQESGWEKVYRLVKKIPRGRVTTYGALAKTLRLRGGARAAGYAMAACPNGRGIPWHRVVAAGGRIAVPEPHSSLQRKLLESEGVQFKGRKVDMAACSWPAQKAKSRQTKKSAPRRSYPSASVI
jgi:methylated-DNA-protein-cysteine methyltransferase-like protein